MQQSENPDKQNVNLLCNRSLVVMRKGLKCVLTKDKSSLGAIKATTSKWIHITGNGGVKNEGINHQR